MADESGVRHNYRKGETQPIPAQAEEAMLPTVYLPMGPEQVESVAVGDSVLVVLRGVVRGVSQNEWGDNIDLELERSSLRGGSREAVATMLHADPAEMFD